jgi:hypothetical protein
MPDGQRDVPRHPWWHDVHSGRRTSKGANEMFHRINANQVVRLLVATLTSVALVAISVSQAFAGAYRP